MLFLIQPIVRLAHRFNFRPRLISALMISFSAAVIPAFLAILTILYRQTSDSIHKHIDSEIGRTQSDMTRAIINFIQPIVDSTRMLAQVISLEAEHPSANRLRDLFFEPISRLSRARSLHISYEDGSGYQLGRLNDRIRARFTGTVVPSNAVFLGRSIMSATEDRVTFFDDSLNVLGVTNTPSDVGDRETESYAGVKSTRRLYISDRDASLMTGLPLVSVAAPIIRDGVFKGAVIENVAVDALSQFLKENRMTPNSRSIIIDPDNRVVATSELPMLGVASEVDMPELNQAIAAANQLVSKVLSLDGSRRALENSFLSDVDGVEHSVSIFSIPNAANLRYRAIILTPTDDFLGDLRKSSQRFAVLVCLILVAELFLIALLSRIGSKGIQAASRQISAIRSMEFSDTSPTVAPPIQEVADLHHGVSLLRSALQSFSRYVPLGVVRKLIEENKAIEPGVEPKDVTILFCDLENFSTLAQQVSPEDLLECMTTFFSVATRAITAEEGTVDKFIGDSVMAIWGAPSAVEDHAVRACRAAVAMTRELDKVNREWAAKGKHSLGLRVGINSAEVLVGNIGSEDRLSYTALGDGVNVASRLEGINKELGTRICISDKTYELAESKIVARPIKPVSVKGRSGEFMVYELLDTK